MTESRTRSLMKAITFRILASAMTGLTFFVFTNNHELAIGFGAVDFITKLILFYLHERAWLKVPNYDFNSILKKITEIPNYSIYPQRQK
jgi:uncharacterized membrane protein